MSKFTADEKRQILDAVAIIDDYAVRIGWSFTDEYEKAKQSCIKDYAVWNNKATLTGRYIGMCIFYRHVLMGLTGYSYGVPNEKLQLVDLIRFDGSCLVALKTGLYISKELFKKDSDNAIEACLQIERVHDAYMDRKCKLETA